MTYRTYIFSKWTLKEISTQLPSCPTGIYLWNLTAISPQLRSQTP
jgi:hypothetical protein